MAQKLLSRLPLLDPEESGDVTAVIETPKRSRNKYDFDDDCAAFRLAGVLPEGSSFPYDFGFFRSTLGEDGDPLDVLALMNSSVPVGCVLTVRLIGVIEARQRKKDGDWIRNDRLIAVATHARTHEHVKDLNDLRPNLFDEIEAFFKNYNALNGREFEPLARTGPRRARDLLNAGAEVFQRKQRDEAAAEAA